MQDLSNPSAVKAACIRGLGWGLEHARPGVQIDHRGNVGPFEDNLLPDLEMVCGSGELGFWMDVELDEYMRSVRSSAALAVNCFGPLMMAGPGVSIGSHRNLQVDRFDRRTRSGFEDAREPHLDVIVSGASGLVAIDPICIDYLALKRPRVTELSEASITPQEEAEPWATEMLRLEKGEHRYRLLDAEHLIERALNLLRCKPGAPSTLVYLYWEPMDADLSPLFAEHRAEIAAFAKRVAGGQPRFEAMSYPELWNAWEETGDAFLGRHVAALRARYEVPAWAWEGVEWRDGRLCSASWLDEFD